MHRGTNGMGDRDFIEATTIDKVSETVDPCLTNGFALTRHRLIRLQHEPHVSDLGRYFEGRLQS